jgi:hypothetical protein
MKIYAGIRRKMEELASAVCTATAVHDHVTTYLATNGTELSSFVPLQLLSATAHMHATRTVGSDQGGSTSSLLTR